MQRIKPVLGDDREQGWQRAPQKQRLGLFEEPRGDKIEASRTLGGWGWGHPYSFMDTPLSRWDLPFKGPGVGRDQPSWGAVSRPALAYRVGSVSRRAWGGARGTWSLVGVARAPIWKDVDSWEAMMEGEG